MAEALTTVSEGTPASEHGAGFPPFQPETYASQLLWLAVFFVALYLIAARLALPRVGSILAERRGRIAGDIAAAARLKEESEATDAAYHKALAEARARAQAVAAEAHRKAKDDAERERSALEARLSEHVAAAERTIAATRAAAMGNVGAIAEDAAAAIVAHLTGTAPSKAAVSAAVAAAVTR